MTSNSGYINLQDLAIFSAVSILSPVSIQTLILAKSISLIVSGTFSYNLSSTAVAPNKVRSVSILSAKSAFPLSLFSASARSWYSL